MNLIETAINTIKGYKEIEVFKVSTYPLLNDIDGLRETASNIDDAIKRTFLGHAKLALVGCGTSGAILMTAVSVISGLDCILTSKNAEIHHRPTVTIYPTNYHHLIVVDDRIDSGQTMENIASKLGHYAKSNQMVKMVCAKYANEKREQLIQLFPNCKYFCY